MQKTEASGRMENHADASRYNRISSSCRCCSASPPYKSILIAADVSINFSKLSSLPNTFITTANFALLLLRVWRSICNYCSFGVLQLITPLPSVSSTSLPFVLLVIGLLRQRWLLWTCGSEIAANSTLR